MGDSLAIVAKEMIEALGVRIPAGTHWTQPPFSHRCRGVTGIFKRLCEGKDTGCDRVLPLTIFGEIPRRLPVPPDLGMSEMFSAHENAAGRRTDRSPRVVSGKPHPLTREPIYMWRPDLGLPITSELTPTEVISEYENDVRLPPFGWMNECDKEGQEEGSKFHTNTYEAKKRYFHLGDVRSSRLHSRPKQSGNSAISVVLSTTLFSH